MPKEPSIFINYRRERTRDKALILREWLEAHFEEGSVFLDEESITLGKPWREEIRKGLNKAEVLLCLIHPKWHAETNDAGDNRLKLDPQDWVRLEIAGAKGRIPIIPILIDGAELPKEEYLPEAIRGFYDGQGIKLDFKNFSGEPLKKLLKSLRVHVKRWVAKGNDEIPVEYGGPYYFKAIDKIFPLPASLHEKKRSSSSPYVGLKPFTSEDAHLFFGRSREIYELCYKVIHQDTPRLLLLDGYSGTGKSSLLQAGIIPRIEAQGWAVAYGRREQDKNLGLSGVLQMLEAELDGKTGERRLLLLDQVEEAITNPIDIRPRELQELAENLAVALRSRPKWKFILSFRSEYTTRIAKALNDVGQGLGDESKYTLYPLELGGIREAVQSVCASEELSKQYPLFFLPESLPLTIAERLVEGRAGYHVAPLIQVNMELLWDNCRQKDGSVRITQQAIRSFIDSHDALLAHYLGKIRENVAEGYADDLAILEILAFYTEEKTTAATRLQKEFAKKFGQDTRFQTLRSELERQYLLTTQGENHERGTRLAHDVLAEPISRQFTQQNTQKRQESENRRFDLLLEQLNKQIYQLEYLEAQKSLKELMGIGIRRNELHPFLFELLFFWNECGRWEPAKEVLQFWTDSNLLSKAARLQAAQLRDAPGKAAIRQWLGLVKSNLYQNMQIQYLAPQQTCMVEVAGGRFERDGFPVEVSSFFLADVPVTFWKYGLFRYAAGKEGQLGELAPNWGIKGDHPVVNVSWYDAIEYCNWMSEANGLSKVYTVHKDQKDPNNKYEGDEFKWLVKEDHSANSYRLPTEAEWEYAARGRGQRPADQFAGSENLDEVGWYGENSDGQTHPVAEKKHNELGLYDMSGNVWEWCWDWYDGEYYKKSNNAQDPKGPDSGSYRVLRGGSWDFSPARVRVADRSYVTPDVRHDYIGFRLARPVE